MKSATWKKLPLKTEFVRHYPRPAGPIVAPSGSSEAAASVAGTADAVVTALEEPPAGVAVVVGAAGAGADGTLPALAPSWMLLNLTFEW